MIRIRRQLINLRYFILPSILFFFIPCIMGFCYAEDEIVIHSYLMRGFHDGLKPGPNPETSSQSSPISLNISSDTNEPDEDAFASLRDEVSSIYQIPYIIGLTSAAMIWDGKRENLNEAVLADYNHLYSIQFYPHSVKGNFLSLKVEAFKFRFNEIHYVYDSLALKRQILYGEFAFFVEARRVEHSVGGEKWLDTELTLPLNEPAVLVLPTGDYSYFLAIQAFKREARQFSIGLINNKLDFFNVSDADPVCGRIIGRGDGFEEKNRVEASLVYKGYTFLFCSLECMEKFVEDPDRYLRKSRIKYFKKIAPTKRHSFKNSFIEIHKSLPAVLESIPPHPVILVRPAFPEACRKKGIHGKVKTELQVDEDGNVVEVHVLKSVHPGLDSATLAALRQWKYKPQIKEGKPASAAYKVDVHFRLKEKELAVEPKIAIDGSSKIGSILKKSSHYCQRLEDAALYFICLERIKETIFPSKKYFCSHIERRNPPKDRKIVRPDPIFSITRFNNGEKNSYIYDYQLIRKEGRIVERRILKMENGNLIYKAYAPLETKRFYMYKPVYGPVGLLGQDSLQFYNYSLLKEESTDGRASWVLEVKPKKLIPGKPNYGKVWVDKQDGSILKMEIEAESLAGYERIWADFVSRGVTPRINVEIDFGLEKNGLHYPTKIICKEAYFDPREGLSKVSEMKVTYQEYKFFTVKTEVKY